MLLELGWKPLSTTHWISDLEDTCTFDLAQTLIWFPLSPTLSVHPGAIVWKAVSLHRHGESFAAATPDLTILRRHLQRLRKRGLLERAAMLQLAACGGLWTEQRSYEAFLQDNAICQRCDIEIESEEHRFHVCKGNAEGDPDSVDTVAKTVGFCLKHVKASRCLISVHFFCEAWHQVLGSVEAPYDGPEVFLVADAIHDGFHFGPGTYFTDGSKLYPDPRRREVGWGFLFCHS